MCEHRREKDDCKICDPSGYLTNLLRKRIRIVLTGNGIPRLGRTVELLGCTIEEARSHLESQFSEGMSWENAGEWHIDHIRPCASFDLTYPEQQMMCFHHTNLQPLWAKDNLSKNASFDEDSFDYHWTGERWERKPES